MNSFDKYQELQEKVNMQLGEITDRLQAHDPGPALNWSKCGDLECVSSYLTDVINFLGRSAEMAYEESTSEYNQVSNR